MLLPSVRVYMPILRLRRLQHIYCHVSWVPWRIITGSGLDDWIYWHCCYSHSQLQSIITSHSQWLSEACLMPYWTKSVFSSAWLTWFWFTNRSLLQLPLSAGQHSTAEQWTLSRMNHSRTPFYNSGRTGDHHLEQFFCYYPFHPLLRNVCQSRGKPFSNGLFRLSGVMSQYYIVIV
jgi:hypothetical protein